MKIGKVPGEFYFKGLVRPVGVDDKEQHVWFPTPGYFSSKEEMEADFPANKFQIQWPVELQENGILYVPSEAELQ